MIKSKFTNKVCILIIIISLLVTALFMSGSSLGITDYSVDETTYEDTIFDDSYVHTINIEIDEDDWNDLLENAIDKEYYICDIEIDSETLSDVAIRTKGNSSLDNIVRSDSDRYSFKVEFDHYTDDLNYYGLDKLTLNNIYQDNTYLKDYLSYDMFNYMGVAAPLASYVYVTINGEEYGLYLAVEAVEDSFVDRVYGEDSDGNLYKPETSQEFKDNMPMGDMQMLDTENMTSRNMGGKSMDDSNEEIERPTMAPSGINNQDATEEISEDNMPTQELTNAENSMDMPRKMSATAYGSSLVYTDDNYDSYSDIFDNVKTDITNEDKDTLIASLKQLNSYEDIDTAIDVDSVIDYFVVHNYLLNYDSYTAYMLHNYYLYEEDGILSMISWDYNLSFGTFVYEQSQSATMYVNYPIDTPTYTVELEERPMLNAILSDDDYLEQYHDEFEEFIDSYFASGYFEEKLDSTVEMISPYVEMDPTAFCTYEEFLEGTETLKEFCLLRATSIDLQLDGIIPTTSDGQLTSDDLIDADYIDMTDLGKK